MLNTYAGDFVEFYDLTWAGYIAQMAPQIRWLFSRLPVRLANSWLLDLGCGPGDLANELMSFGDYRVVGVDLSADMVAQAIRRNRAFVEQGKAAFEQGDIRGLAMDRRFGIATATYCVVNHFDDLESIRSLFRKASEHLDQDGVLYFDVFTEAIRSSFVEGDTIADENWEELHGTYYVQRAGWIDGNPPRLFISVSGFTPADAKTYRKFSGGIALVIHDPADLEEALVDAGFSTIAYLDATNLTRYAEKPKEIEHLAVVAGKSSTSFSAFPWSPDSARISALPPRFMLAPRTDLALINGILRISAAGSDLFVETSRLEVLEIISKFVDPARIGELLDAEGRELGAEIRTFIEQLKRANVLVEAGDLIGRPLSRRGSSSI